MVQIFEYLEAAYWVLMILDRAELPCSATDISVGIFCKTKDVYDRVLLINTIHRLVLWQYVNRFHETTRNGERTEKFAINDRGIKLLKYWQKRYRQPLLKRIWYETIVAMKYLLKSNSST